MKFPDGSLQMERRAVKIASKSGCPDRIFGCPHTKKKCWLPGNIIKCLVYFVVPMNAAVHVMCTTRHETIKYMPISRFQR